jgi:hypothetical protein
MNDTQLLERLSSAYATLDAPAPSVALAAVLDAGAVGEAPDDERPDAVVIPLVRPQTRLRVRHLVAAMVATFVLFSGLAVAGALPDPVQRQVSSVVSHLGIDIPSPQSGPASDGGSDAPRGPDRSGAPSTTAAPGGATATTLPAGGAGTPAVGADGKPPATPSTTAPASGLPLGGVGDVGEVGGETAGGGPVTTLPPPDPLLPPLTVPQLTLPPLSLPPLTLPPITLGPITITPLPLPLPLPLGL